eukprot:COSAG06_NODE_23125_length_702_cov_0.442786_1_plen_42_part_10
MPQHLAHVLLSVVGTYLAQAPGLGGMSVRETLDDWFYAAANA